MPQRKPRTKKLAKPSGEPPCAPNICEVHQQIPWAYSPACPAREIAPWLAAEEKELRAREFKRYNPDNAFVGPTGE